MAEQESGRAEALDDSDALMSRLLAEAERAVAEVMQPHLRAPMLARLSVLHADGVPEVADAMSVASAIDDPYVRSIALAEVSSSLVTADVPAAARAARAALRAAKVVPDMRSRTIALAEAAGALGVFDRVQADRALAEAQNLAESACSCHRRCLLAAVLERTAGLSPEDALRNANQIPDPRLRGIVLVRAIQRLATADPQRAVALVEHVPELHEQIEAWVSLCDVLANIHPKLAVFAAGCAEADAGFSHNALVRLRALTRVARSVHDADPARAGEILAAAEAAFEQVEHSHQLSRAAAELARAKAVFDLDAGVAMARQIAHSDMRAHALLLLAEDLRSRRASL